MLDSREVGGQHRVVNTQSTRDVTIPAEHVWRRIHVHVRGGRTNGERIVEHVRLAATERNPKGTVLFKAMWKSFVLHRYASQPGELAVLSPLPETSGEMRKAAMRELAQSALAHIPHQVSMFRSWLTGREGSPALLKPPSERLMELSVLYSRTHAKRAGIDVECVRRGMFEALEAVSKLSGEHLQSALECEATQQMERAQAL